MHTQLRQKFQMKIFFHSTAVIFLLVHKICRIVLLENCFTLLLIFSWVCRRFLCISSELLAWYSVTISDCFFLRRLFDIATWMGNDCFCWGVIVDADDPLRNSNLLWALIRLPDSKLLSLFLWLASKLLKSCEFNSLFRLLLSNSGCCCCWLLLFKLDRLESILDNRLERREFTWDPEGRLENLTLDSDLRGCSIVSRPKMTASLFWLLWLSVSESKSCVLVNQLGWARFSEEESSDKFNGEHFNGLLWWHLLFCWWFK